MFFDPANLNVHVLKTLIQKLTDKYAHAIRNDRPLKDVKEIKKAIHYVERKIALAERCAPRAAEEPGSESRTNCVPITMDTSIRTNDR